ncbi:MAG: CopG family transcriptional regulator [Phycisphaerae bacterium]|nr:CopG family transcriptional regulator [Phycisphaerae bacterium]
MSTQAHNVITFKADESLVQAMRAIPNRSDFIRSAILAALDSTCPLCHGTGILTPEQRRHWVSFSEAHDVEECGDCHEWHLVCRHESKTRPRKRRGAKASC